MTTTIGILAFGVDVENINSIYAFPGFFGAFWGIISGLIGINLSYPNHFPQATRFCPRPAYILMVIFTRPRNRYIVMQLSLWCNELWKSMAKYVWKSGMIGLIKLWKFEIRTNNIIQRSILYDSPEELMERREVPEKKHPQINSKTHLKYALRSPEVNIYFP